MSVNASRLTETQVSQAKETENGTDSGIKWYDRWIETAICVLFGQNQGRIECKGDRLDRNELFKEKVQ